MSDTAASLIKRAQEYQFSKQFDEAMELYQQILKDFPDTHEAGVAKQQLENIAPELAHRRAVARIRPCSLCKKDDTATLDFPICGGCATVFGLIPLPPARRPAAPCARCSGRRFVRVVPRQYCAFAEGGYRSDVRLHHNGAPMTLTVPPIGEPDIRQGLGTVEAYVCAGCGFIDWYCQDPQSIKIGHEYNTELVEYSESEGPYR